MKTKQTFMKMLSLILGVILFSSILTSNVEAESNSSIPSWIKEITIFWANGQISDEEYLAAIQWLIDNNILKSSHTSIIQDKGDFYAVYSDISNTKLQNWKEFLEKSKFLETIALGLNTHFKLPYDVKIVGLECGTPNAYYNPAKKELVLCYEFPPYVGGVFQKLGYEDTKEIVTKIIHMYFFVIIHELGHVLIDVHDIPITGMEEDAVDQLAALYITRVQKSSSAEELAVFDGKSILKTTAIWFAYESSGQSKIDQLPFWDEHSLDQQRFYNILCWMYGSSPDEYSSLVRDGLLPKERAVKCEAEYEKMSKSWKFLLSPYIQDTSYDTFFRN